MNQPVSDRIRTQFGMAVYRPEGAAQIQGFGPPRLIEVLAIQILCLCAALALAAALVFATTGTPEEKQAFRSGFRATVMMGMMMRGAK